MLARDRVSGEEVAIKFLGCGSNGTPCSGKNALVEQRTRILREVKVLEKLRDKAIIKLKNAFVLDTNLVIIMEYASGGELKGYVAKRGRLDENEARSIFIQLLNAVEHCHTLNVIHRDLKLENVLFSDPTQREIKVSSQSAN